MATYYVTSTAIGGGSGTQGSPMNLSEGLSTAIAGDIVYIQKGDYGSSTYSQNNNGSSGNPIRFIGTETDFSPIAASTKVSPYDGVTRERCTFTGTDDITNGDLPFIDSGLSNGQSGVGDGLTISGNFVEFENFAVRGYLRGIIINGDDCTVKNVAQDFTGLHTNDNTREGFILGVNCCDGRGIVINGARCTINNSFSRDASHIGFEMNGDNGNYNNNEVYSSNLPANANTTDYQYLINGDNQTHNNVIIVREVGTVHRSHGIVFRPEGANTSRNNVVDGFYCENSKVELQNRDTQFNLVRNGFILDTSTWTNDSVENFYDAAHITFANGPQDNVVENVRLENTTAAVKLADWGSGANDAGLRNRVNNIVAVNCREAFIWYDDNGIDPAIDFRMYNCTFDRGANGGSLFRIEGGTSNLTLQMKNCNLIGFTNFIEQSGTSFSVDGSSVFDRINIDGGSLTPSTFTPYVDSNITQISASYVDTANYDYTPVTDVLEIGGDFTGELTEQGFDFDGETRTSPFTVGAFEFNPTNGSFEPVINNNIISYITNP